ncbi:hypothetical protein HAX54_014822, partial [Datura stramonium]|nr:hypothetical protein [Datura stramonium]
MGYGEVKSECQQHLKSRRILFSSPMMYNVWTLYTDGASNVKGTGLDVAFNTTTGEKLKQAISCVSLTNNEVEYEVILVGIELAQRLRSEAIIIICDSQFV